LANANSLATLANEPWLTNLGMASQNVTKKLLCIECKKELPRADYKTSQWKLRANRTCKACQLLGILSAIPVEQHGDLGGQSAAAAGDVASAGAGGDFLAASPPSNVLGAFVFRNLARPGALSDGECPISVFVVM